MQIRRFSARDAVEMEIIFRRAVREIAPAHYTNQQIAVWTDLCPSPDRFIGMMTDGRIGFVAVSPNDEVVAFGDLERDGHIVFLYALPDVAGTGVMAKLYTAIEEEARQQGIGKLYCEASEGAKSFLSRQGFSVLERRDIELSGVAIHNYAVEKRLRPLP
ncbi:GNAT family N-acetyltransferase [Thalassospira sp. MA62]|nr:GNAT family N-acetyltransferase [Thalassospira sp. MA62]